MKQITINISIKKSLLFFSLLLLISPIIVFGQQNTFSKVIDGSSNESYMANGIVSTLDSCYIIVGGAYSSGLILKIDSVGDVLWNKTFLNTTGVFPDIELNCIIADSDSTFVIGGSDYNDITQKRDAVCVKINSVGDTIWYKTFSSSNSITTLSVNETNDSGFILTGFAYNYPSTAVFLAKLDSLGDLQWANQYVGSNNAQSYGYSVKPTLDNGFIVTGFTVSPPSFAPYAFLLKLQSNGPISWSQEYSWPTNTYGQGGNDVEVIADGYICYLNGALMKTDLMGNVLWAKSFSGASSTDSYSTPTPKIRKTEDNGFALLSTSDCSGGSRILKTDSVGNLEWAENLAFMGIDMIISNDNGYIAIGNGPLCGIKTKTVGSEIGIIKTDSLGNGKNCITPSQAASSNCSITSAPIAFTTITGAAENNVIPVISTINVVTHTGCVSWTSGIIETEIENSINIAPNPTSGFFTLKFSQDILKAEIKVYNLLGELISSSIKSTSESTVDISDLANGVYIIEATTDNIIRRLKLIKQ